jgi:cold shock CspA family protein
MRGQVRNKLEAKGFGFIISGQREYFFHVSQCVTPFNELNTGDEVEFETEDSPKGKRAVNVERV